jgi:hypothetical protein
MTTPNSNRWIASLKSRIRQSQTRAAVHINSALIELYWSIGADIVNRQAEAVWGSGIFNQISRDIRTEFPDIKGFSKSNLYYMKQFYLFYSQGAGNYECCSVSNRGAKTLQTFLLCGIGHSLF